MMFIDGTGIGGPIVDRVKQMGYEQVQEVQFGWAAPDAKYANMRAYMWGRMKDWLQRGAIDADAVMETDLTAPGYRHNNRDQVLLESKEDMKKRGLSSPDDADALALTFAQHVGPAVQIEQAQAEYYMPTSDNWMADSTV
jgi:hypothetical protein